MPSATISSSNNGNPAAAAAAAAMNGSNSKATAIYGNLSDSELAQVSGFVAIPVGTPDWKRTLMEKKNREAVDAYMAARAEEERERSRHTAIPEWKRNLIDQKQAKQREEAMPVEERRRREEEEAERLAGMPEWKRNIVIKKKTQLGAGGN